MELQDPARVPREWPKPLALGSCGLEYTAPPAGSEPDLAATPDSLGQSLRDEAQSTCLEEWGSPAPTHPTLYPIPPKAAETPRFWNGLARFRNRGKARKG